MALAVFKRAETKYLLTEDKYQKLMKQICNHLKEDKYYKSNICNVYFDNDNDDLIINSLEKPMYKEKIRLRSYNVPKKDDIVFLELKKKYKGIVNKRRVEIKLKDFYEYYNNGTIPDYCNTQIMKEIDYAFKLYNLKPKVYLAYDRLSFYDKDNPNFRITFDTSIRSRINNLNLEYGNDGIFYFEEKTYIMEAKVLNALPFWFIKALEELDIYSSSFSKYGSIYSKFRKKEGIYA